MRKLLVPVDGSDNALRAIEYVAALARDMPIEVEVLNVQEPVELLVHGYLSKEQVDRILEVEARSALRPATDLLAQREVAHHAAWRVGSIAATIDRHLRESGCDGIVMGTRGMSAFGSLALGSIATKVVHLADVPVTLVK